MTDHRYITTYDVTGIEDTEPLPVLGDPYKFIESIRQCDKEIQQFKEALMSETHTSPAPAHSRRARMERAKHRVPKAQPVDSQVLKILTRMFTSNGGNNQTVLHHDCPDPLAVRRAKKRTARQARRAGQQQLRGGFKVSRFYGQVRRHTPASQ